MKTGTAQHPSVRKGGILVIVMVIVVAFSLLVIAMLQLGAFNAAETARELRSAQAFWLAEAGREMCIANLYNSGNGVLSSTTVGTNVPGVYKVEIDPTNSNARISTGTVTVGGGTVTRRIRINLAFLPPAFEHAIYAGNYVNTPWYFQLRGTGNPGANGQGGRDIVNGDVYINGNAYMYDASEINEPSPNRYYLSGDLDATGSITVGPNASVDGTRHSGVPVIPPPVLPAMNYAVNNTYDIAKIFNDLHINSGYLPSSHPLYNVVVKNPSDRAAENASTPGDDFYFEPHSIGSAGTPTTAVTPLNLGTNQVYYVDGNVWFDNRDTYGFKVDGTATIVATADIHVSDNLQYNNRGLNPVGGNPPDMLALVALGKYTGGSLSSGGNIYFGDPRYGTTYTVDAFMFAGNNFYYNLDSTDSNNQQEPTTGFQVFGNFMAVNQVVVLRDWYTPADGAAARAAAYLYDTPTSSWKWKDAVTGVALTPEQINGYTVYDGRGRPLRTVPGMRHYQMQVSYDDRIRDIATQVPGLPRGNGAIFNGIQSWEEISP